MPRKLPKIITQEEFEKLLDATKKKEYKLAMLLGFEAGMRISEIVGLKAKDGSWIVPPLSKENVDLQLHTIRVISGKGRKDRVVPLPKRFSQAAHALLPIAVPRRTLQHHVTMMGKKILGKNISFHTTRHGFGTHLANAGRPLHEIQALMGHSRLDTTGIYLHANPKEAIEKARELF